MDDLIQKAVERRNALRRELETLDRFIHDYTARVVSTASAPISDPQDDLFNDSKGRRKRRAANVAAMMDSAEEMILQEGEPMTRGQLLARLEAQGHVIEGGDKNKVLGTNLWRSKRFHNIQGVGYWPKSMAIPREFQRFPIRDTMLE
jgi:hypothetical protein